MMEQERPKADPIGDVDLHTEETQGGEKKEETSAEERVSTTGELQALQDKYLRLAAEFDNYKKLAQRDRREYTRFANEQLLKELLPTVDNLERAIQSAQVSRDTTTILEGVKLTLKQFLETLAKFGVRQISSLGQPFDPSHHQAVSRVDSTEPEGTVVEELQKGYLLHERILRPAMVAVATGPGDGDQPRTARPAAQEAATREERDPFGSGEEPGAEA